MQQILLLNPLRNQVNEIIKQFNVNTAEKKLKNQYTGEKKLRVNETHTRKNLGFTIIEKNFGPRNTHEKLFWTHEDTMARWQHCTKPLRPTVHKTDEI